MNSYQNLVLLQNYYKLKALGFSYSDAIVPNEYLSSNTPQSFEQLSTSLKNCYLCDLSKSRTQTMLGCGDRNANILFVDSHVSQKQDQDNSCFVGRSGEMLQKMIENVLEIPLENIYYTHAIKCKTLGMNKPSLSEWNSCKGYLHAEIELIQPKVIIALGEDAYRYITNDKEKFEKIRGHMIALKDYKVIAIYHPNYLLRNPELKKIVFNDLKTIKGYL